MTDQTVLELLRQIDNGYIPTMVEKEELSAIKSITWREVEKIPESIDILTALKELNVTGEFLNRSSNTVIPDSIVNLSSLHSLSLINMQISMLPDRIWDLASLRILYLSNMQINKLPDRVWDLSSLKILSLINIQISTLPDRIWDLSSLQSLYLSNIQISTLLDKIGDLTSLQSLYLSNMQISTLPDRIWDLSNLRILYLSNTQINTLPDKIWGLLSLQSLSLINMQISMLPDRIGDLSSLQSLDLSNTQISTLPDRIGDLSSLQSLDLSNTQISTLPDRIGDLSSLQSLYLSNMRISTLPDRIGDLSSLQILYLCNTQICALSASIWDLSNLQSMYLSNTQISTLPERIGNLSSLQILDLSNTQISMLPDRIGELSSLQILYLSNTQISTLPDSIGDLSSLQILDLSNTQISTLPDSIGDLSSLQILDLSNTQISTLPDSIGGLSSLQRLDLSNTQIRTLPDRIGNLSCLQILNLSNTSISKISKNIATLPELKELVLEELTLSELPEELLYLNLDYRNERYASWQEEPGIYIRGLRLQKQPVSLFYQSRELIQKYFDSDKEELKESKVIFMGDGGAGKSYTIQRIINEGMLLEKDTNVTHDIVVEHWDNSAHFVDYDGTIDFWDFGGQDIYLSMHRCFLTERSCYVIVLCNRQYGSHRGLMRQARYWLKTISSFAKKSPILIAVNTWRGQPTDGISLSQLKSEFPELNIADQIIYDAHDQETENFMLLISRICRISKANYSYGLQFPISWNNIRNRLLMGYISENLLPETEYYRICQEEMMENDGYFDKEAAHWLLHWFNDLGYCFDYHNIEGDIEGEEYHVLKPQWVIKAMYKIINYETRRHPEVITPTAEVLPQALAKRRRDKEGRISKIDIIELLASGEKDGESYSEKEAEFIIRILCKFKLAYLLKHEELEDLFIPALCSDLRSESFDIVDSRFILKMEYLVRFRYLPETVLQQLMIKCYQNGRKLQYVWKYGFHLLVREGLIAVEMLNDTEIKIRYYEPEVNNDRYGLHEMRTWLAEVYQELGIENARDFIIVPDKQEHKMVSLISVKALVNAYIENSSFDIFYTQDNDKYQGHLVDKILSGLYGSNYKEIIDKEVKRRNKDDLKKKEVVPEALSKQLSYTYIADIIEKRFRTQFTDPPESEKTVQEQLRKFFDAQGYQKGRDYERESGKIQFAGREYIPDFVFKELSTVIEVKISKERNRKSKMIEEMNADYSAYTKEYNSIIFLVYDIGIISDIYEFRRDFESKGNVRVIVIKH